MGVDMVLDTDMVDTVEREKLKLPQKLMPKPGTETLDTDTVPDTDSDLTDMEVTDSDMDMVDTVERDPLMPGTDADTVMVVTDVDTPDMEVTDTESKYLLIHLTKETILYKIMPL